MKEKRKTQIFILSLIIVALFVIVSGKYMTSQSIIGTEPKEGVILNYPVCVDNNYICKYGAMYTGETTTWGNYIFLCDIDNIVKCPNECELKSSVNPSEGMCVDSTGDAETIPDCTEDYMQCGLKDTVDPEGDIYRCVDGEWKLIAENDGYQECKEYSAFKAEFITDYWYCIGGNSASGISLQDSVSAATQDNCFPTLDAAYNNIGYCCYDEKDDTYIWRYGNCIDDELYRFGTNIDEDWCKEKQSESSTTIGSNYEENCIIYKSWGTTDPYGNYECLIINPLKIWWFWTGIVGIFFGMLIYIYRKSIIKLGVMPQIIAGYAILLILTGSISYFILNGIEINFGLFSLNLGG